MATLTMEEITSLNLAHIPPEGKTIADTMDLNKVILKTDYIKYYMRHKEDCPFGRGNWIVDLGFDDGEIFRLKFPKEMSSDTFMDFIKPLLHAFYLKNSDNKSGMVS